MRTRMKWASIVDPKLRRFFLSLGDRFCHFCRDSPKSAVARAKLLHRGIKVSRAEVRPQTWGEIQFRVSNLPQWAIAQALFAASPDQQIDVGAGALRALFPPAVGRNFRGSRRSLAGTGARLAGLPRAPSNRWPAGRAFPFRPRLPTPLLRSLGAELTGNRSRRPMTVTRTPQGARARASTLKNPSKVRINVRHFALWSAPVVRGEGEEREHVNAEIERRRHRAPNRGAAGAVTLHAWQSACRRPAPVAVHNDRHVSRFASGFPMSQFP